MKILVVTYAELNSKPSKQTVIEDLQRIYRNSDENVISKVGRHVRNLLEGLEINSDVDISYTDTSSVKTRQTLVEQCRNNEPDIVVTYNLAGFEQETLTDGIAYNLVDCRQFHIINAGNPEIEKKIENKVKSINMFFVDNRHE